MRSTIEPLEDNKVKLSVEVDEQEFEKAIDQAFKKIASEVRLPGFRPGKAPRRVLEARLGNGFARGEALREALPEYYIEAVREHEVDVIASPQFDITAGEESGAVAFDAVVEVRPKINVAGYGGLRVEVPDPEPTDEEISAQIDAVRDQYGELRPIDHPAIDGNHVTMDINCTHEGEPVDGLTADDYVYEVGSGAVVDEIDEQLRGSTVGDILQFDAPHPAPDEDGTLAFRILVKEVQEKVLPDLDDDFAREATEFDTVDELRADLADRIGAAKRAQVAALLRDRVAEALAELVDVEVPTALVDSEIQNRIQDMAMRLQSRNATIEQYIEATGRSPEEFVNEMREPAGQAVRVDLALRSVAEAENLEASDADIDDELARYAEAVGAEAAVSREQFEEVGQLSVLSADIAKRKALDWLLDHVEIVDPDGRPIDRASLEEPPADTVDSDDTVDTVDNDDGDDSDDGDDTDQSETDETEQSPDPTEEESD